ncbi:MAG: MFS transporter, partial [Bifidobacteriaceae bacterium]|nr:MFS transporter [Bifidobacteriaceae bacterium]
MTATRPSKLIASAYIGSYALSILGNSIAAIALPLIVLRTTGSVMGAGTLAAATAIPAFAAGLTMGVVIDRVNRRSASITTDLISAASVAALPLIDLVTGLNLGWFIAFGIIGSLGDVPGLTARDALVPGIVRATGIAAERLLGLKESLGAVAMLVGPAVAGVLLSVGTGPTVLWVTAATSASAALLTCVIPRSVGQTLHDAAVPVSASPRFERPGPGTGQPHAGRPGAHQAEGSDRDARQPDAGQTTARRPDGGQTDGRDPDGRQSDGCQ